MLLAGGNEINPGGIDRGVPQNIRQPDDVPAYFIKRESEQVPQVVREDLGGLYPRFLAQLLHFPPDLTAGKGFSASGEKYFAGGDFLLSGILEQFAAKLARQKNCADFTLQTDFRPAMLRGFHRKSPFMH